MKQDAITLDSAASLRALRKAAGWSQLELAMRAGVHQQTVKYWETERPGTKRNGGACKLFVNAFTEAGFPAQVPTYRRRHSDMGVKRGKLNSDHKEPPLMVGHNLLKSNAPTQCGAKTRNGKSCQMKPQPGKTRCALHGGLSTGPKTNTGRDAIAAAQRARWERHRQARQVEV